MCINHDMRIRVVLLLYIARDTVYACYKGRPASGTVRTRVGALMRVKVQKFTAAKTEIFFVGPSLVGRCTR